MSKSLERIIVSHGAPTLAGHKCGSLLFWRGQADESLEAYIREQNERLNAKGLRLMILKDAGSHALVYVYRPAMLQRVLADEAVRRFLYSLGYKDFTLEACLRRVSRRLCGASFPHEIGIFLHYPLADVKGFIKNPCCSDCCAGYWKAYADKEEALRRFCLYRKCRQVYLDCYTRGFDLLRLTVAA